MAHGLQAQNSLHNYAQENAVSILIKYRSLDNIPHFFLQ